MSLLGTLLGGVRLVDPATPPGIQPAGQASGWQLAMSEEFNGALTVVDVGRNHVTMRPRGPVWQARYPDNAMSTWGQSPHTNNPVGEGEYYHHDALAVSNGALHMIADQMPLQPNLNPYPGFVYRSGMIQSRPSYTPTYGYFEARMWLPGDTRSWPAFWLFQAENLPPAYAEIDIMECFGSATSVAPNLHYNPGDGSTGPRALSAATLGTVSDWHTYAVEWRPDGCQWYLDGAPWGSTAVAPAVPMYVLLNLAMYRTATDTPTQAVASVDYVRCWTAA